MINSTNLLKKIGENLHTVRNVRKETLQNVASHLGFTHPTLSKIENGRHQHLTIALLTELCNYYSISFQQIIGLEDITIFQILKNYEPANQ